MNGHVFQVHSERSVSDAQQFTKTVEALGEYAAKKLKCAGDIGPFFKDFELPVLPRIKNLTEDQAKDDFVQRVWTNSVDDYCKRNGVLQDNFKTLYSIAWGQCSEAMKAKLQSHEDFEVNEDKANCAWLLKEIRAIIYRFEGQRYIFLSLDDAHSDFRSYRQQSGEPLSEYLLVFKTKFDILEHYGGTFGSDKGLITASAALPGAPSNNAALLKFTKNRALAIAFLKRADQARYGALLAELENQFSRGTDQYPPDLTAAYNLLLSYRPPPGTSVRKTAPGSTTTTTRTVGTGGTPTPVPPAPPTGQGRPAELGLTFTQTSSSLMGSDGNTYPGITCFRCERMGHYASNCPSSPPSTVAATTSTVQLLQTDGAGTSPSSSVLATSPPEPDHGFSFAQRALIPISKSWVLLDSESTISVFNNPSLLRNIRHSPTQITVHTNGGTQVSSLVGDIPNFGTVWFNPESIANILSLAAVRKLCRVTMDTALSASFTVHKHDGSLMVFHEFDSGLYYHETGILPTSTSASASAPLVTLPKPASLPVTDYSLLTTVAHNKSFFTRRELEGADRARDLYRMIGRPSESFFQQILQSGTMIHNCPITIADAKRALFVYGPDLATLKGKTTKQNTNTHIPSTVASHLPNYILDHHREVTLCIDIFFVQGQRFYHTISRKIKFRTIAPITTATKTILQEQTTAVINAYHNRGFLVTNIHADGAFECLREMVAPTILNINATDDHVGEVERSIRTIKERVRATAHGLPYKRLPREMIKGIVRFAVRSLNQFPAEDGVSDHLSPTSIVTGLPPPDYNQMKLEFGQYTTVFEDNNPTNTNAPRIVDAIALHHTGNAQGDYYFMSLATGERISRRQYTMLPITQRVIAAVEGLARAQGQPQLPGAGPAFTWDAHDGNPIHEEEREVLVVIEDIDNTGVELPPAFVEPPNVPNDVGVIAPAAIIGEEHAEPQNDSSESDVDRDGNFLDDEDEDESENENNSRETATNAEGNNEQFTDGEDLDDEEAPRQDATRYNLRPSRARDYSHRFGRQLNDLSEGRSDCR
jgi:Zinc knuckle